MDKATRNSYQMLRILFAIVLVQGLVSVSIIVVTAFLYKTHEVVSLHHGFRPHENAEAKFPQFYNLNNSIFDKGDNIAGENVNEEKIEINKKTVKRRGLSSCAKERLLKKRAVHTQTEIRRPRKQFDIVTTTNWEFVDMTENWLEGMRRLGLRYPIYLVCEDKQSYTYFKRRANSEFQISYTKKIEMSDVLRRGSTFQDLILKRIVYIRDKVKNGRDILLADVDAVWLKDPMHSVMDVYNEYDVWIARGKTDEIPCPCFMYLKANAKVIQLTKAWVERIHEDKTKTDADRHGKHVTDQWALQPLLQEGQKKGTLKVKWLEKIYFPTGDLFFDPEWNKKHNSTVVIAHGNHQGRHDGKKEALTKFGLWYLQV